MLISNSHESEATHNAEFCGPGKYTGSWLVVDHPRGCASDEEMEAKELRWEVTLERRSDLSASWGVVRLDDDSLIKRWGENFVTIVAGYLDGQRDGSEEWVDAMERRADERAGR